jgi:hypothetical protein
MITRYFFCGQEEIAGKLAELQTSNSAAGEQKEEEEIVPTAKEEDPLRGPDTQLEKVRRGCGSYYRRRILSGDQIHSWRR